jgi:hypothetical protein
MRIRQNPHLNQTGEFSTNDIILTIKFPCISFIGGFVNGPFIEKL